MTARKDFTQIALAVVQQATGEVPKTAPAPKVEAKRKGGLAGSKARAAKLSPEERATIAKKAAEARWKATEPAAGETPASGKKAKVRL